ncbi:uncharacterized protein LOC131709026 [Acipenser ruthenus]|uniref:uncharacterized protein LOC131709026 n=1 Tax=Acipenser ruthenus TaxID=7906 RepID=UPI0027427850|nr:uncharacterized protein LOC131709026 [Acipenser ruthenus]
MCRLTVFIVAVCALMVGLSVCCPPRRYHVSRDTKTWDQARQYCQSNFIDLVSVPSEEEMLAVKALISRLSDYTFWLGLRRNTVSSPWEWSTGVAFQYSKWLSWEPDANGDCGVMIPTGEWGAEPCGNPQCFVCMAGPSALCGQREYFLVDTVKNADEAREHCRSLYTDLVSITSQDVLLDIEQLMNKDTSNIDYWIGLRRDGGSWGWGNGETFSYSNWGETWSTSDCVTLKTSHWNFGAWQVNNCNDNNKFICYKDLQNPTTVQSGSKSSPTTRPASSQIQSKQPSTMGSTSPPAAADPHDTTIVQFDSSQTEDGEQQSQHPSTMASPSPPAAADPQDTTTVQSDSQSSPTTRPAASQTPDGGEQSQQPSTMDGTSPQASSPGHSGTSPAAEDPKPSSPPSTPVSKDPNPSDPPSTPVSKDNMAIGRVKLTAPKGMNLEDPKVSEAILEQIREHLSQTFPMDGMKMRWRKQDGEIFHKDVGEEEEEDEEDEEKCSDL